jgi:hypothetical protein
MPAGESEAEKEESIALALAEWQQGDYTLSVQEFAAASSLNGSALEIDVEPVEGLVVISQTCDIVNFVPGREHVIVCPLVRISDKMIENVRTGRTPSAAILELSPAPTIVADLSRMMSISKAVLASLERRTGFNTDAGRGRFADSLQRKHGRFSFPDAFSNTVISELRGRILSAHNKNSSDHGKAYRSIQTVRVTAFPSWGSDSVTIHFHFVLEPESKREASRKDIASTLSEHLRKLEWPDGFIPDEPLYNLVALEDMTAAEWTQSQPVDWDFVSWAGKNLI